MGGDCTNRRTQRSTAPRAGTLTDTWENIELSADGWNFAEFSILGETVTIKDDANADVEYSEFGFTKVRVTARGAASLTQEEIDGLFDADSDPNPLTFDGFQDAASRPEGDFHSLKFTFSDIVGAPKKMLVQKVEMEVIDPYSNTFLDLSQEIYSRYTGNKIDLSSEAITLVAKNDDGDYTEFAKYDLQPITCQFIFQHRSDVYAMITDNFEIRFRDPRVQIKHVKIYIFDCENNAIRANEDGKTSEEQSELIAFANPNYGNARIGDISSNVLNMCLKLGESAIDADGRPIALSTEGYELLEEDGGSSEIEWLKEGQCSDENWYNDVWPHDCTEDDKSMADLRVALIKTSDETVFIESPAEAKEACAAYGMYPAYSDVDMVPKDGDDGWEFGTLYRIFRKWVEKYDSLGESAVQIVDGDKHVSFIGWVLGVDTDPQIGLNPSPLYGSLLRVMETKKQMFGAAGSPKGNLEEVGGFGEECCEGGAGLNGCGTWSVLNDVWRNKADENKADAGVIMDMLNWDNPASELPKCAWFVEEFRYRAIICAAREEATPNCPSMELCKNALESQIDPDNEPNWIQKDGDWCCGGFLPDNEYTKVAYNDPDVLVRDYNQQVCENVDPCAQVPGPCGSGVCIPVTFDNYLLSDQLQMPKEHSPHYTCTCPAGKILEKQMAPFVIPYDDGHFSKQMVLGSAYDCVDVPDCEFRYAILGTHCECPGSEEIATWDDVTNAYVCAVPPTYCKDLEKERMPPGFRRVWPKSWTGLDNVAGYPDDAFVSGSSWKSMWVSPMWQDKKTVNQEAVRITFLGDRKLKQWTLPDGSVNYEVDSLFDDDADTFFEFDHFNQTYQASENPDNGNFELEFAFYETDSGALRKRMLFDRLEITLHQSTMNRIQYGGIQDTVDLSYRGPKIKFGYDTMYATVNDEGAGNEWYLDGANNDLPNTFVINAGSRNHSIITDRVTLVIKDPAIRIAEIKLHFFDCESLDIKQYANPNYKLGTIKDMSSFDHSMCGDFPVSTVGGKEITTTLDNLGGKFETEYSNYGGDPNLEVKLMGYKYALISSNAAGFTFNSMSDIEDMCGNYGMYPPFGSGYKSSDHGIGQAYDTLKAAATALNIDVKLYLGIKSNGAGDLVLSEGGTYLGYTDHENFGFLAEGGDMCTGPLPAPFAGEDNDFNMCLSNFCNLNLDPNCEECQTTSLYLHLNGAASPGTKVLEYTSNCNIDVVDLPATGVQSIICMKKIPTEFLCGTATNCIDSTVDSAYDSAHEQCCGIRGLGQAGGGYIAHTCGTDPPCTIHSSSCGAGHTCEDHVTGYTATSKMLVNDYHGDFMCKCKNDGFFYDFEYKTCVAVNECTDEFHACRNTICVDQVEGYTCDCENPAQDVQKDGDDGTYEYADASCFECPCDMKCSLGDNLCTEREQCVLDPDKSCSGDPCDTFGLRCPVGGPYHKPGEPGWSHKDPSLNINNTCHGELSSAICEWDCEAEGVGWSCEQEYCFSKSDCIYRCPHGTICGKENFWQCSHPSECIHICTEEFNLDCFCPDEHTCPNPPCGTIDECTEDPQITCQDVYKWELNSHLYKCYFDGSPNYECLENTWDYLQENCYPKECEPVPCTATFYNKERCVMGLNGTVDGYHTWDDYWAQYEAGNVGDVPSRRRRETGAWGVIGVTINCIAGYKRDVALAVCNDVDECASDCTPDPVYGLWDCFNQNDLYTGFTDYTCTDTVNNDCAVGVCKQITGTSDKICVKYSSAGETITAANKNVHRFTPFNCVNTVGSYYIDCEHGFMKDPNTNLDSTSPDIECVNIIECGDPTITATSSVEQPFWDPVTIECANSDVCTDTEGSYTCTWECTAEDCKAEHTYCSFDAVAGAQCHCKPGYAFDDDTLLATPTGIPNWITFNVGEGNACLDVDECQGLDVDGGLAIATRLTHNCNTNVLTPYAHETQVCTNTDGSFYCSCLPGYELTYIAASETYTCIDINECNNAATHQCLSAEYCMNEHGSYSCLNECIHTDCGNHGRCVVDHTGEFQYIFDNQANSAGELCVCDEFYELANPADPVSGCVDINECSDDPSYCGASPAVCENLDGGVNCYCPKGYFESNPDPSTKEVICVDINECEDNGAADPKTDACNPEWANGVTWIDGTTSDNCVNTAGSYECAQLCVINNCAQTTEANHPQTECVVITDSSAKTGSELCACASGFVYHATDGCVDIDECASDPCGTVAGSRCVNDIGYFHCECDDKSVNIGWTQGVLTGNTVTCLNINECSATSDNECLDVEFCTDNDGNYDCINPSCVDNSFCDAYPNSECNMKVEAGVPGSATEECVCVEGYDAKGTSGALLVCYNINECTAGTDSCSATEECVDTTGSYFCRCPEGYEYVDGICVKKNICDQSTHPDRYPCGADQSCKWLSDGSGFWQEVVLDNGDAKCGCPICPDCKGNHGIYSYCAKDVISTDPTLVGRNYYDCVCHEGFEWENGVQYSTCVDINECETIADPCAVVPEPARPDVSSRGGLLSRSGTRMTIVESRELKPVPAYQADDSMCYSKKNPSVLLECPTGSTISVTHAAHGRWDENTCCFSAQGCPTCDVNNDFDLIPYVNAACRGQSSCEFIIYGQSFIPDCIDSASGDAVRAHVDIKWDCVAPVKIDESHEVTASSAYDQKTICVNYPGYYTCNCPVGYKLDSSLGCLNVNECEDDYVLVEGGLPHVCTDDVDKCFDSEGSYYCAGDCDATGALSKAECICLECDPGCGDVGSYSYCQVDDYADPYFTTSCVCQPGYEKATTAADETQCVDIHECNDVDICGAETCTTADCLRQDCIEFSGSYECRCPQGYEYDAGENLCFDVNECSSNGHVCIDSKFCVNTMGSYQCTLICDDCTGIENSHCEMNTDETDLICACDVGFARDPGDDLSLPLAPGGCLDINECAGINICTGSNAICVNTFGSYNCKCPDGYELIDNFGSTGGSICVDVNECDLTRDLIHNCFANQTCENRDPLVDGQLYECVDIYTCLCSDDCNNAPNTVCKMEYIAGANQNAQCECEVGYDWVSGNIVDGCEDVDECNDATLHDCAGAQKICDNTIGSYECICNTGYKYDTPGVGQTLNTVDCIDINECADDTHTCDVNALCDNDLTPGSYDCICNANFWDSDPKNPGHKCYPDCPDCTTGPFMTCNNDLLNPECICINDQYFVFADTLDKTKGCVDINECEAETHDCSSIQADVARDCQNELFGFSCCCPPGYELDATTDTCLNIDECSLDIHHCHVDADCDDTIGSFTCTCQTGFRGNGYECIQIECPACDPVSQQCTFVNDPIRTPHIWAPTCICNEPGFIQNGADALGNPICDDVDECDTGSHNCDALFTTGGGPQDGDLPLICRNTIGSFSCECPYGFDRLSLDGDCEWIPIVCAENCLAEQYCGPRDDGAGLECRCNDGLVTVVHPDGSVTCEDDDECEDVIPPKHDCDSITEVCYNTLGSYACPCALGFKREFNGATGEFDCVDINECTELAADPCDINAECTNSIGSFYCQCNDYYVGNGEICILHISLPCTLDCDPDCGENANCLVKDSLIGPAECECWPGFDGNPTAGCIDINECNDSTVCDATEICVNIIGSYTCVECPVCVDYAHCAVMPDATMGCYCDEGFTPVIDDSGEITECLDINECEDDSFVTGCTDIEYCENTFGDYECRCKTGYERDTVSGDCVDVNECKDETHQCGPNSICSNMIYDVALFRGYDCSCPADFIGNGFDCLPDCELCGVNTDCTILADRSDKICLCKAGYELVDDVCIDINECVVDPVDSCGANTDCYNCDGDYTCDCKDGFKFDTNGVDCIDIHECDDVSLHGCAQVADCIELPGSWNCECPDGFSGNGFVCHEICPPTGCGENEFCTTMTSSSAGTLFETQCLCNPGYERDAVTQKCIDINECSDSLLNICDDALPVEICMNTEGSYACGCPIGYAVDGIPLLGLIRATSGNCLNINECDYNHACHPRADCVDTDGSYTCTCTGETFGNGRECPCLDGFAALNETSLCLDINECEIGTHFCDVNANCTNTYGSYECECVDDFFGDGLRCFETCPICGINAFCSFIQNKPTCECHAGYAGNPATICDDVDECEDDLHICDSYLIPEECVNTIGAHTCECPTGYRGEGDGDCLNINECVEGSHNCDVDAICTDTPGSFTCECKDDFLGNGCFCHPICKDTTCGPGAHCTLTDNPDNPEGDLECRCNDGYVHEFGSDPFECIDINECLVDVLSCNPDEDCINTEGSFECACKDGFKYADDGSQSANCININECQDNTDDCHRAALCEDNFGSYTCTCVNGYIGNGKDCQPECPDCGDNGVCVIVSQVLPSGGSGLFTYCKCDAGFKTNADGECEDVDECLADLCGPNTDCENIPGSYLCPCADGFEENSNGLCDDVNECILEPNPCDGNADCLNTFGSYLCTCNDGYAGDGECCKPTCPDCGAYAKCVIEDDKSFCVCKEGYEGDPYVECEDVNECETLLNDCWITDDECINLPGSYLCTCPDGFARNEATGICEDRDECSDTTHNCGTNAICENTVGSWTCVCPTGYEGNGLFCVSKKEIIRCTEDCLSTEQCVYDLDQDEYRCECAAGYEAGADGSCEDINECSAVVCDVGYSCVNYPGGFDCVCPPGFEHDPLTSKCVDIDECLTKQHDCAETAFCTNLSGSYLCTCDTGYTGNGRTCDKSVICGEIDLCHPSATCDEITSGQELYSCSCPPGTFGSGFYRCEDNVAVCEPSCGAGKMCVLGDNGAGICICLEGYAANDDNTCSDINECETIGCSNGMECVNLPGSFQCLCAPGTEAKIASTGEVVCGDTDECAAENMCSSNAKCVDMNMATDGEPYRCECKDGYHGTGTTCCDTNECGDESHDCDENASCKNTEGSYECYCKSGWEGSGKECNPICPEKQKIGADGETCECKNGYRPVDAEAAELECEDIDECDEELHNCDINGICVNTDGSYICDGCVDPWFGSGYKNECCEEECGSNQACFFLECKCKPGYYKDYLTGECFPYCDPVCSRLEVCDKGRCVCKKGYTRNILGECEKLPCDCHDLAQCDVTTNSLGQMLDAECVCNAGFEGDGVDNCEDINECDVDPTVCGDDVVCCNLYGDFVCVCPCGYEYIESSQTCVDIDECASGSHACDDSQNCFNQDGFHECACRPEDCGVVLANKRIEMRLPCVKPEPYNP